MARKPQTPAQKEAARKAREEKVAALNEQLSAKVEELASSEGWNKWLASLEAFHKYSINNTFLILSQCPHASQVAGFKTWQSQGRVVRKGEKAIRIFGLPFRVIREKDEVTGEETRKTVPVPPMVLSVFDISQTEPIEGAEQTPEIVRKLVGEDTSDIYAAIEKIIVSRGWTVERETIPGAANGFCTLDGSKRIVVEADLSPAQAAKTACHELAHSLLHANEEGYSDESAPTERDVRELEAESVAAVVSGYLGLDTSPYSTGYLASWSGGDADKVRATATRVRNAVHQILDSVESTTEVSDLVSA